MKKLIIQIPCYNEAQHIAITLSNLPRKVDGFDRVEWLIIDDGSTDKTAEIAEACGVDHIVTLSRNRGLSRAFLAGLDACLRLGADAIVNTDGDNQYNALDIPRLLAPIAEGKAEIVIGARPIDTIGHFSYTKKLLQRLGSWVVRIASKTEIPDATSGFRAITRDAAMKINVFNDFTYTLEMIIQAGQKNMSVASVPVRTNDDLRASRLSNGMLFYVRRSIITIWRIFVVYRPFRFFITIGILLFSAGFLIGLRYLYFLVTAHASGHVQSLILASVLLGIGFQTMLVAFLADLQSVNRRLMEDVQYRLKKIDYCRGQQGDTFKEPIQKWPPR